jgi:hypothetical protein
VLNDRTELERHVFFEVVLMKRALADVAKDGLGASEELEARLASVLRALAESGVGLDLQNFDVNKGGEPFGVEGFGDE